MEQRCQGTLQVWAEPFVTLRLPKLFNLRTDPYEQADITSNTYYEWLLHNDYFIVLCAFAAMSSRKRLRSSLRSSLRRVSPSISHGENA